VHCNNVYIGVDTETHITDNPSGCQVSLPNGRATYIGPDVDCGVPAGTIASS